MATRGSLVSRTAALAILAIVLSLPYFALIEPIMAKRHEYRQSIAQSRSLIEQYRSRIVDPEALRGRLREVEGEKTQSTAFLQTESVSLAAAELQGRLGRVVRSFKGDLTSTQPVPVTEDEAFQRVTVRANMKVSTSAMRGILYQLESGRPYLLVDNLVIRSDRRVVRTRARRRTPQRPRDQLDIRFDVYGYLWKRGEK